MPNKGKKYTKCFLCGRRILQENIESCNCGCEQDICPCCNEDIPYPSEEDEGDN